MTVDETVVDKTGVDKLGINPDSCLCRLAKG